MSTIMDLTLQGGLLIVAAALLRAALGARIPRRAFVAIWLIAALRLVLPFEIASPMSLYGLIPVRETAAMSGTPRGGQAETMRTPSVALATPSDSESGMGGVALQQNQQTEAPQERQRAFTADALPILYLSGALLMAAYFFCANLHLRRRYRGAREVTSGPVADWLAMAENPRHARVYATDKADSPVAMGLFRPRIILPLSILHDADNLPYILAHELIHVRRCDALAKLPVIAALCAHWFNPLVWLLFILTNRDIELACDEKVIRDMDQAHKKHYAHLLLRMQVRSTELSPFSSGFSRHCIKERITAIMKHKKTSVLATVLALVLVFAMTVAFATSPEEPQLLPSAPQADEALLPHQTEPPSLALPSDEQTQDTEDTDPDNDLNPLNLNDEEWSLRAGVVQIVDQMLRAGSIRGIPNLDEQRVDYTYGITHVPLALQSGLSGDVLRQLEAAYEQYRYVFRLYVMPDDGQISHYYVGALPLDTNVTEAVACVDLAVPSGEKLPRAEKCLSGRVESPDAARKGLVAPVPTPVPATVLMTEDEWTEGPSYTPVPTPVPDVYEGEYTIDPIEPMYDLVVDVTDQKVYAYEADSDTLVRTMVCSTGLKETPTPVGDYRDGTGPGARWHYFSKFNCWAQYAFYIDGDIMFHSVLFAKRGGQLSEASVSNLGTPASHGSVRLSVEDAQWIWEHCVAGTRVIVAAT